VTPWLDIAESYIGLKEIKGVGHNPTILGWLRDFGKNIGRWGRSRDETPWCAVFVSHCLHAAGMQTTESALAASYVTYGRPSKFIPGAVIVIKPKKSGPDKSTGSRAGNHTGFLLRVTKTHYYIVAGNQGNRVSRKWFSKKRYQIKACRWPVAQVPQKP
jgi:uncharacterized protein (TIGR02594 family)